MRNEKKTTVPSRYSFMMWKVLKANINWVSFEKLYKMNRSVSFLMTQVFFLSLCVVNGYSCTVLLWWKVSNNWKMLHVDFQNCNLQKPFYRTFAYTNFIGIFVLVWQWLRSQFLIKLILLKCICIFALLETGNFSIRIRRGFISN